MVGVKAAELAAESVQSAAIPSSGTKAASGIVAFGFGHRTSEGSCVRVQIIVAEQLAEGGR
jgi:hypothetical protein